MHDLNAIVPSCEDKLQSGHRILLSKHGFYHYSQCARVRTYCAFDFVFAVLVGSDVKLILLGPTFGLAELHDDVLVLIHEPDWKRSI